MSDHRVDLGPEWAQMGEGVPPAKKATKKAPTTIPAFELLGQFIKENPDKGDSWGAFIDWLVSKYLKLNANQRTGHRPTDCPELWAAYTKLLDENQRLREAVSALEFSDHDRCPLCYGGPELKTWTHAKGCALLKGEE